MANHNILGKNGEAKAKAFLEEKGYLILGQNLIFGKAEIDILALYNKLLVVVEVKTRSTNDFGEPEEFVSQKKQELLATAIEEYIEENKLENEVRFDIISVVVNDKSSKINHIENAFFAE